MKIVADGLYYAFGAIVVGVLLSFFLTPYAGLPFYALAAFCLYFFRDPERNIPSGDVLVSPADGKVVAVRQLDSGEVRVSIFLNIFNVHVNRTPIGGRVSAVQYQKGKFLVASHEAASQENEQNTLIIEGIIEGQGTRVVCRQIAGLIARRIVCFKRPGDTVAAGERIGYIKFGSRTDVIFGPEWSARVKVGDKVAGGSTVLAQRSSYEEIH